MTRVHPGWLVALFAAILSVSAWLPWLTTSANGGGRASAIGGSVGSIALPPRFGVGQLIVLLAAVLLVAGAMIGGGLFSRLASVAALVVSLGLLALGVWYYRLNIVEPITAAYGLYLGGVAVAGALGASVWAVITAVRQ
ncbi:hypothetical protein KV112_11640 [Mycolicibacter sp. MYC123]|uniref:Transmembrane protein n=2 Tax=Mycolicibacter TaxID=1073531 RepID=A0ABU5YKR9_9MYCO|nr:MULTISPECIES: hypothetical protein [unclassified Mycolicibacter]MEB3050380.1 hypothetical protein [Mycolicibacter sp. MYC123]MEB3064384.1 hypothetical protein [Mycolicibacter sp. MYC101]MEB3070228.1 hypothetical protein [Mycolicibacter sp. MYC017]